MKKIDIDPKFVDSFHADDEGGYTPKGKGKRFKKAKKTEAKKLQGWKDWDYFMRQSLDYATDDDTD